jgi:hypothetical protein
LLSNQLFARSLRRMEDTWSEQGLAGQANPGHLSTRENRMYSVLWSMKIKPLQHLPEIREDEESSCMLIISNFHITKFAVKSRLWSTRA